MTATTTTAQNASGSKRRLRPERVRETTGRDGYAEFMERSLKAYARRVAGGDTDALEALIAHRAQVDEAIVTGAVGLLLQGFSYAKVGACFGISRQAAMQRFAAALAEAIAAGADTSKLRQSGGQTADTRDW